MALSGLKHSLSPEDNGPYTFVSPHKSPIFTSSSFLLNRDQDGDGVVKWDAAAVGRRPAPVALELEAQDFAQLLQDPPPVDVTSRVQHIEFAPHVAGRLDAACSPVMVKV